MPEIYTFSNGNWNSEKEFLMSLMFFSAEVAPIVVPPERLTYKRRYSLNGNRHYSLLSGIRTMLTSNGRECDFNVIEDTFYFLGDSYRRVKVIERQVNHGGHERMLEFRLGNDLPHLWKCTPDVGEKIFNLLFRAGITTKKAYIQFENGIEISLQHLMEIPGVLKDDDILEITYPRNMQSVLLESDIIQIFLNPEITSDEEVPAEPDWKYWNQIIEAAENGVQDLMCGFDKDSISSSTAK